MNSERRAKLRRWAEKRRTQADEVIDLLDELDNRDRIGVAPEVRTLRKIAQRNLGTSHKVG